MTPFKDLPEGQTHYEGDGCQPPHVLPHQPMVRATTPSLQDWKKQVRKQVKLIRESSIVVHNGTYVDFNDALEQGMISLISDLLVEEKIKARTETKDGEHTWKMVIAQDYCAHCNSARTLYEGKWLVTRLTHNI